MSSGEGLIWGVRDAVPGAKPPDPGVRDKRAFIIEPEFGSVLKVISRSGNTLSPIVRQAWDGPSVLQSLTKNSIAKATEPHISIVGHITQDELRRQMTSSEVANGFANRFLWCCVRRSKCLPDGGNPDELALSRIQSRTDDCAVFAQTVGPMERDEKARALWHDVYRELSKGRPGLLGAATSRAEAHVVRLSCLYALLDMSATVRVEHLRAALALWDYCAESARYIFGDSLGDEVADTILDALQGAEDGISRTDISELFHKNRSSHEIGSALRTLQGLGLAKVESQRNNRGRPTELWFAAGPEEDA